MSNVYVRNNRIICFKRATSKLGTASEHFSPLPCQGNAEGSLSRLDCISCALQILGFSCDHHLYLLQKLVFILSPCSPLWHLFQREMGKLAVQTSVGYLCAKSLSTLFKVCRCTFGKFVKVASSLVITD